MVRRFAFEELTNWNRMADRTAGNVRLVMPIADTLGPAGLQGGVHPDKDPRSSRHHEPLEQHGAYAR